MEDRGNGVSVSGRVATGTGGRVWIGMTGRVSIGIGCCIHWNTQYSQGKVLTNPVPLLSLHSQGTHTLIAKYAIWQPSTLHAQGSRYPLETTKRPIFSIPACAGLTPHHHDPCQNSPFYPCMRRGAFNRFFRPVTNFFYPCTRRGHDTCPIHLSSIFLLPLHQQGTPGF